MSVEPIPPRIMEFQSQEFLDAYLEQSIDPPSPGSLKSFGIFEYLSSFLDLACASGYFAYHLADQYLNMTVRWIDFHPKCIEEANKRGNLPNLRYDEIDITKLDQSYGTFDGVRINNSLHHFNDLDNIVRTISSVLNQDGILMISDFDREVGFKNESVKKWYEARKKWGPAYQRMFAEDNIWLDRPIRRSKALIYDSIIAAFTLKETCQSLEKNGFSVQGSKLTTSESGAVRYYLFARKK